MKRCKHEIKARKCLDVLLKGAADGENLEALVKTMFLMLADIINGIEGKNAAKNLLKVIKWKLNLDADYAINYSIIKRLHFLNLINYTM